MASPPGAWKAGWTEATVAGQAIGQPHREPLAQQKQEPKP